MIYCNHMKQFKVIFLLGIWFVIIPITGIPLSVKKLLIIIPGLLLMAIGVTLIRTHKHKQSAPFNEHQEELVHEIAEDIAEDIIHQANTTTSNEIKKLRDIL
jgi:hypothetical protein